MTPSPDERAKGGSRRGSIIAASLMVASIGVVFACNLGRDHAPPPALPPAPSAPPPVATEVAPPVVSAQAPPPVVASPILRERTPGHELDNFYEALRGLEKKTRAEHARVFWYGDSHAAADFWSGAFRAALQKRFGDGGPGFTHVGFKAYRHEGLRLENKGSWHVKPRGPSTVVPTGDGVLGLGGVLLGPYEGGQAVITVADPALPKKLTWDFCYKLGSARDEIALEVTGGSPVTVKQNAGEELNVLRHVSLESKGAGPVFHAAPTSGLPEFCGVVIEADPHEQAGVVVDQMGINGARLATQLAWDERAWVTEAKRRSASLVVLEYGTNEASDEKTKPEAFAQNMARVMARMRAASPACDCLVLSNTERADRQEKTLEVQSALKAAARASGCGFWDTYAAMGGKGGILQWRGETSPRASPDGIHLTARGYRELGDKLASDVLSAYVP